MADTIWIARHGNRQDFVDSEWSKTAERPYDPGLSPDGVEQARRLADRMQRENISAIFSSPFLRTVETASHIAEALQVPIFLEPGLSEWYNDEWFPSEPKTLSKEALIARFPMVDLRYSSNVRPVYGESESDSMRRAAEAAHAVVRRFPRPVLFMGHGATIAGLAKGFSPDSEITSCGMCCLFKFRREGANWTMELCADVSHLEELVAADRWN